VNPNGADAVMRIKNAERQVAFRQLIAHGEPSLPAADHESRNFFGVAVLLHRSTSIIGC
jgi:hypothetical protein